jgi:hypothetical protein
MGGKDLTDVALARRRCYPAEQRASRLFMHAVSLPFRAVPPAIPLLLFDGGMLHLSS